MIYDTLSNVEQYRGLSQQMDLALDTLKNTDFNQMEAGKYFVNELVYFNIMEPTTKVYSDTKWECHRNYIDIQYVLNSGEQIAYCPLEDIQNWSEYSEAGDSYVSVDDVPHISLPMGQDRFAIFFPEDAHRPCWAVDDPQKVKKVVIKVHI